MSVPFLTSLYLSISFKAASCQVSMEATKSALLGLNHRAVFRQGKMKKKWKIKKVETHFKPR
jgi:hypothetical protein